MPDLYAALFNATLLIWGLKISISVPEFSITTFTHWASKSLDAGWCGLPKVMKNSVKFWVTISDYCDKYV